MTSEWRRVATVALVWAAAVVACQPEFQPYYELQELRVMGIRADKPWFGPGEVAHIDPLIHNPDPALPLQYSWSWCPLSSVAADGFECQISEEQLAESGVPFLPYDLGQTPTIDFPYPTAPEALQYACRAIAEQGNLPDFVPLPDCEKGFPVTVTLVLESETETIRAVKEVVLVYGPDDERNRNPVLGGLTIRRTGQNTLSPLVPEPATLVSVERGVTHQLQVRLSEESSERYTPTGADDETSEPLVVTWFVEGGELEKTRTSFFPGETSLATAEQNDWVTPSVADFEPSQMRVYAVLRDGRGGVDWIASRIALE